MAESIEQCKLTRVRTIEQSDYKGYTVTLYRGYNESGTPEYFGVVMYNNSLPIYDTPSNAWMINTRKTCRDWIDKWVEPETLEGNGLIDWLTV